MTLSHAILRDLVSGQTTADSAAGRLKIETSKAETLLIAHAIDGHVIELKIQGLSIYQITDSGRDKLTSKIPS